MITKQLIESYISFCISLQNSIRIKNFTKIARSQYHDAMHDKQYLDELTKQEPKLHNY